MMNVIKRILIGTARYRHYKIYNLSRLLLENALHSLVSYPFMTLYRQRVAACVVHDLTHGTS